MKPKSIRFTQEGMLVPGNGSHRSFKTLAWDQPSITVAYGHREVHVHPDCKRRLSVYEAMLLQGFPKSYELLGTLSSQITQVSEAVPPKMAEAVADAIFALKTKATMRPAKRKPKAIAKERSLAASHGRKAKASIGQHRNWLQREARPFR
jgi:DNA (cytosine-5)-methyltransferase 1